MEVKFGVVFEIQKENGLCAVVEMRDQVEPTTSISLIFFLPPEKLKIISSQKFKILREITIDEDIEDMEAFHDFVEMLTSGAKTVAARTPNKANEGKENPVIFCFQTCRR